MAPPPGPAAVVWWTVVDWLYAARWQVRSLRRGDPPEEYARGEPGRVPVVLVPGVYESWRFLQPLIDALNAAGHPVHVVPGLGINAGEVPAMAAAVLAHVEAEGLGAAGRLALVGHSKGGLIGKRLLVDDADGRFERLVAVNTPFSGSARARWLPLRALRVFVPETAVLRELAAVTAVDARITSVHSAVDANIPGGSHLPGATNVRIDAVGHFRVLSDPRLQAAVLAALR